MLSQLTYLLFTLGSFMSSRASYIIFYLGLNCNRFSYILIFISSRDGQDLPKKHQTSIFETGFYFKYISAKHSTDGLNKKCLCYLLKRYLVFQFWLVFCMVTMKTFLDFVAWRTGILFCDRWKGTSYKIVRYNHNLKINCIASECFLNI